MRYLLNSQCAALCLLKLYYNCLYCDFPPFHPLQVKHGNLEFDIGFVRYLPEGLPLPLIIGPAAGAVLIILLIILIVAIYRHIGERDRRIKRLEKQRDEMEMRVAQECKDGKWYLS